MDHIRRQISLPPVLSWVNSYSKRIFIVVLVLIMGVPTSQAFSQDGSVEPRDFEVTISLYRSSVDENQREQYEEIIRYFADGVFESSNGAHRISTVNIYIDSKNSKDADIVWNDTGRPNAWPNGRSGEKSDRQHIFMFDVFDLANTDYLGGSNNHARGGYALAHEWGHYFYGLFDEYRGQDESRNSTDYMPHTDDDPVECSIMTSQRNAMVIIGNDCDSRFDWLNFSTDLNSNEKTAQFRVYRASGWGVLLRNPERDKILNPNYTALSPRTYYEELADVAPNLDERPQIDLPNERDTWSDPEINWISDDSIQILIDRSNSMSGNKVENAKQGAKLLVELLDPLHTKIGIIQFNHSAEVLHQVSGIANEADRNSVYMGINLIQPDGGTAIGVAAKKALEDLLQSDISNSDAAVFLLSDGRNEHGFNPLDVIADYQKSGIPIYTVGYGDDADHNLLRQLANQTGGQYLYSSIGLEDLVNTFQDVNQSISSGAVDVQMGLNLLSPNILPESFPFYLDSDLSRANLVITHDGDSSDVRFNLLDPQGQVYSQPECEKSGGETICLINIIPVIGNWEVVPELVQNEVRVSYRVSGTMEAGENFPVTASLISIEGAELIYPEPILLLATLSGNAPIAGANVVATVQQPDGSHYEVDLRDDGIPPDHILNDGAYSAILDYKQEGIYEITAHFDNEEGKAFYSHAGTVYLGSQIQGEFQEEGVDLIQRNFERIARLQVSTSGVKTDDYGNDPGTSTFINTDNIGILGKIDYQDDLDVFRVEILPDEELVIRIGNMAFGMDPKLRILGTDGNTVLKEGTLQSNSTEGGYLLVPLNDFSEQEFLFIEVSHIGEDFGGLYTISAGLKLANEQIFRASGGIVPPKSGGSLVFVVILLVVGGSATYAILSRNKRLQKTGPSGALLVSSDGSTYPLKDQAVIGRSSVVQIQLHDATISRRHAQLRYSDGAWFIQDLGSAGGTFVNGQQVQAKKLAAGDLIKIGNTNLTFQGN